MRKHAPTVLTYVLLWIAHYNLLLLLLFDSLHVLLKLLLATHGLPIWEICHLVVVLALQFLSSANVGRAITLLTLIEEAIMRRILRTRLLLERILSRIDYGYIFE